MHDLPHGDYVIFADESGDPFPGMSSIDYPMFVLSFCIFVKHEYINHAVPNIKRVKFAFWGHDMAILHSTKIRRQTNDFYFLQSQKVRKQFMDELTTAIGCSPFSVISSAVDKRVISSARLPSVDLYAQSLEHCLERIYNFLQKMDQNGKLTYIVIESRMPKEDKDLEAAFHQILSKNQELQRRYPLRLIFADKRVNSIGLQVADLVAYPIGRYILNSQEKNLPFEVVEKKLVGYPTYTGKGLEIFSAEALQKQKAPDSSEAFHRPGIPQPL